MAVYMCRWPNGDFSVVKARTKDEAIEFLDEVGNAEGCPLFALEDFMAHFKLTDVVNSRRTPGSSEKIHRATFCA